jgi:hypothetical protein
VNDLRRATQLLAAGSDSCVLCRGEDTLVSGQRGVAPLVDWLADGVDLRGFSAADRVVGRAAALLYAVAGVVAVHADLASQPGLAVLAAHGIHCQADTTVPGILNRNRTGPCPMETAVAGIDQPKIAADRLQAALRGLRGQ